MNHSNISELNLKLINLQDTFLVNYGNKPNLTDDGFAAAIFIFSTALMDKMWELQERENISMSEREKMANSMGNEIRKMVKTYTDKDTFTFYK